MFMFCCPTDWQLHTMFDSSGHLTLHYGKHHTALITEIRSWFDGECFADVDLVCEGKETLKAHRLVLASSSPLIKQVLEETPSVENPVTIQFPGVRAADMKLLLHFLYTGEAYVQVCTNLPNISNIMWNMTENLNIYALFNINLHQWFPVFFFLVGAVFWIFSSQKHIYLFSKWQELTTMSFSL